MYSNLAEWMYIEHSTSPDPVSAVSNNNTSQLHSFNEPPQAQLVVQPRILAWSPTLSTLNVHYTITAPDESNATRETETEEEGDAKVRTPSGNFALEVIRG